MRWSTWRRLEFRVESVELRRTEQRVDGRSTRSPPMAAPRGPATASAESRCGYTDCEAGQFCRDSRGLGWCKCSGSILHQMTRGGSAVSRATNPRPNSHPSLSAICSRPPREEHLQPRLFQPADAARIKYYIADVAAYEDAGRHVPGRASKRREQDMKLYKQPGSKYWYVYLGYHNGKRVRRSTKQTKRGPAQVVAAEMLLQLKPGGNVSRPQG
jgi:hypothetical protein